MTLSEIYDIVRRDLGEAFTNNDRVSDARLLVAANAQYVRRSAEMHCFSRSDTLTSVVGQVAYTLDGDVCDIRGVRYHTGTTPLTRITEADLSVRLPSYRDTAAGTPEYYYLADTRSLSLYPKPDTISQNITVDQWIVPYTPLQSSGVAVFTLTTDSPAWPPQFHELLAHDLVFRIATRFKFLGDEMQARAAAAKEDADRLALEFAVYVSK